MQWEDREKAALKQLQIPDPDLSELLGETPIDSAVLCISCSSSTTAALVLHPCTTGRADGGEKDLC